MYQGMKSVMVFDAKDSKEETAQKWIEWNRHISDAQMEEIVRLEELIGSEQTGGVSNASRKSS